MKSFQSLGNTARFRVNVTLIESCGCSFLGGGNESNAGQAAKAQGADPSAVRIF